MDFVSRHAASSPEPTSVTVPTTPSAASSANVVAEEPEYLARYFVVKHSWRGRYKRILCISNSAITTLDPGTLSVTNSYDLSSDFEGAAPVIGRGGGDESSAEFTINVRTDGKGKFKGIKFSSRLGAGILTELHRVRWGGLGPVTEFPVRHLRRKTSEWVSYVSTFMMTQGSLGQITDQILMLSRFRFMNQKVEFFVDGKLINTVAKLRTVLQITC